MVESKIISVFIMKKSILAVAFLGSLLMVSSPIALAGGAIWEHEFFMWNEDLSFTLEGTATALTPGMGAISGTGLFGSENASMFGTWSIDPTLINPAIGGKLCVAVTPENQEDAEGVISSTYCGLWKWDGTFTLILSKVPLVTLEGNWFLN